MGYKVVTAPVLLPFDTAHIKSWLKIPASVTAEDTIVEALIKAAVADAQHKTRRALLTQTIEEYFDCYPYCGIFDLSVAPVQSVTSVMFLSGGSYTAWSASNYSTDIVGEPCRVVAKDTASIPVYDLRTPNVWKVTYVAGYSSADLIPQNIIQGMRQKIAFDYENREDIPLGGGSSARKRSADSLLYQERML